MNDNLYSEGLLKSQQINENLKKANSLVKDVDLLQTQESLIHLVRSEYIHRFDIKNKVKLTETAFRKLQSVAFNHGCSAIIKVNDQFAPVIVWPTRRDALGRPSKGVFLSPFRVDANMEGFDILYDAKEQDLTKYPILEFATFQGFFNGNTLMGPVGIDLIRPQVSLYINQMNKLSLTIKKSIPMVVSMLTTEQNENINNAFNANPEKLITPINAVNNVSKSYANKAEDAFNSAEGEIVAGKITRLDTQFNVNDEIKAIGELIDVCRDFLGIRKEPRFKAERKISSEVESEKASSKISEKVQEEQLNMFVDEFNKIYNSNIELVNNLDTIYSDNLKIQGSTSQFKSELGDNNE